jgi:hypothetical protein
VVRVSYTAAAPDKWFGPDPVIRAGYYKYFELAVDKDGLIPRHIQPIMAAQILGRARVALYRVLEAIENAGYQWYYTDTDSVHTNCPPDKMPVPVWTPDQGKAGLGVLASEGGPYHAIYLGPKAYCLIDQDTGKATKGALKGVPWASMRDGIVEYVPWKTPHFRQARDQEKGSDLRRAVFEQAFSNPGGVHVAKEGIMTFAQGARLDANDLVDGKRWRRWEQVRTIAPRWRTIAFPLGETKGWYYRTAAEVAEHKRKEMPYPEEIDDPAVDEIK